MGCIARCAECGYVDVYSVFKGPIEDGCPRCEGDDIDVFSDYGFAIQLTIDAEKGAADVVEC